MTTTSIDPHDTPPHQWTDEHREYKKNERIANDLDRLKRYYLDCKYNKADVDHKGAGLIARSLLRSIVSDWI
jgi:hypothetical protein